MKNPDLDFVVSHYRHGALNLKSAYRATVARAGQSRPRMQLVGWAVAAVVAALVIGGAAVLLSPDTTTIAATYTMRTVRLQDGTVVVLAPHSALSYKGDCRSVELEGKAYLTIHHDRRHPFTISDDRYKISDLGTRLLIDETGSQTKVYVEEGSVALSSAKGPQAMVLGASEGAVVDSTGQIEPMKTASPNITTWATRQFRFSATPLRQVLSELSAYYGVDLACTDTDGKRLTANFRADNLTDIVSMIEETLNVTIIIKQ